MLEQVFGSGTRVKLLSLFIVNPDNKYFVRELTRLLDCQINAIRRELENLNNIGIIKIVGKEGFKKYYQIDQDFIIYKELKDFIQKSNLLVEQNLAKKILKIDNGKIAYLVFTGYFTSSNTKTDILIVGDVNRKELQKLIKNHQDKINKEINYTIIDLDEFKYRRNVADRFLLEIEESPKIVYKDELEKFLNEKK